MRFSNQKIGANLLFTIGSDPEFPIVDQDGIPRSAIDVLAPKDNPTKLGCGGMIYADNVNCETQVPPADTRRGFISNVSNMFLEASEVVENLGYRMIIQASVEMPESELRDPRASEIGCIPEYCVYNVKRGRIKRVPPPIFDESTRLRSCGGHIHIGAKICQMDRLNVIKSLDFVLGVASVLMDNDETAARRRNIYGGAGYHRPTTYGVEYRTPDNSWLTDPRRVGVMYDLVDESLLFATERITTRPDEEAIVNCINNHDKALAREIWTDYVRPVLRKDIAISVEEIAQAPHSSEIEAGWGSARRAAQVA